MGASINDDAHNNGTNSRVDILSENAKAEETEKLDDQNSSTDADAQKSLIMDAGVLAWLQVLGSWILFANSCISSLTWTALVLMCEFVVTSNRGLSTSFGVFQTYYSNTFLPEKSPSSIAWIGSIQLFLTQLAGAPGGWLIDAGYLYTVLITGSLIEVFGLFMLSLSREYWQIVLAQAICTGLGSGLLGIACAVITPLYFRNKRSLVMGIAATGSSVAGIVYPLMIQRLLGSLGFAWAVRVFAFVILGTMAACIAVVRDRPQLRGRKRAPMFRKKHLRDAPFVLFSFAYALIMSSSLVPLYFIEDYGLKLGLTPELSNGLISIINATSLFGRIIPGWLADRYGGFNVVLPCSVSTAIIVFFFRLASDKEGLITLSAIYGFTSGAMIALVPAIIANITTDMSEFGTRIGMAVTFASVFALVGYPIAGAGQRSSTDDAQVEFQGSWFFAGAVMFTVTLVIAVAKHLKYGILGKEKF